MPVSRSRAPRTPAPPGPPRRGLAEVVADGETGLLVDKEDPAALARAVAHLLKDPGTAERMGQAARRRAQELFGLDGVVDAYAGLYRRLAEEATHAGNT